MSSITDTVLLPSSQLASKIIMIYSTHNVGKTVLMLLLNDPKLLMETSFRESQTIAHVRTRDRMWAFDKFV